MLKLTREQLLPLERYAEERAAIKAQIMQHKLPRRVALGPHATLLFEDGQTIKFQVQEMLRVERIFDSKGIQEELDAYNPLIPDGDNWKATLLLEYPDPEQRQQALAKLVGIENRIYVQAPSLQRVYALADEDMERTLPDKTSSVHFLRFQFSQKDVECLKSALVIKLGVDHKLYQYEIELAKDTVASLLKDFD